MRLKPFLFLALVLSLIAFSVSPVIASERPPSEITISEAIYADLALRGDLDHVSVYYFDGNITNTVSLNAEKKWVPASTIKLFTAMYAYYQVASGKIGLDQLVVINDKNVAPSQSDQNGYPPLEAGDTASVYRLVDQMIIQSDNTAFNTLLDLLDRREITKYIHDLGLVNSSVGGKLNLDDSQQQYEVAAPGYDENVTTADDYAKAFILINGGRIPGSTGLFDILSRQKLNSMIPSLLPPGVTVAHKTGELNPYYHDGGIIVGPNKRYILSVFSDTGDPSIVAHISRLIYTKDVNLIGSQIQKSIGEEKLPPVDPLVEDGTNVPQNVLAESTQNIPIPNINAADIGITSNDLSHSLEPKQLPKIIFPPGSPLHFLIDLGDKLTTSLNPIPSLKVQFEVGNLKLKLAEASDLISKGKIGQANRILNEVDTRLSSVASQKLISQSLNLQTSIDQISETRFSILKSQLQSLNQTDKVSAIQEIARQAKRAVENIEPYTEKAVKTKELSQRPLVGEVVRSTPTSLTIKTSDGKEVTTPLDPQIKTRSVGERETQIQKITEVQSGTTIALVGFDPVSKTKPSFILTKIASESATPSPVTVLKVNLDTNTLVVAGANGSPIQVDLTKQTVIKGANTNISLNQIKKGDAIVVRGEPLASHSASQNLQLPGSPSETPSTSKLGSQPAKEESTSSQPKQSQTEVTPRQPVTGAKTTGQPQIIKGSVIQVVEKAGDLKSKSAPKPKEEKKKEKEEEKKPTPTP